MSTSERPRRGPKRSESSREAILAAAFELTREIGYGGLTVEGIAARARVGKQTIYRWWPGKGEVLFDALAEQADLYVPGDDRGSLRADLEGYLTDSFTAIAEPGVAAVLRSLMGQAQIDSQFGERFRARFFDRRRAVLDQILERAGRRGDLPRRLSPELVWVVVFGVTWQRILTNDGLPGAQEIGLTLSVLDLAQDRDLEQTTDQG